MISNLNINHRHDKLAVETFGSGFTGKLHSDDGYTCCILMVSCLVPSVK